MITIDDALVNPDLLGAAIGEIAPWRTWRIVLRAAFALGLGDDEEHAIFAEVAGGRPLPAKRARELWCVIGRRGGKSKIAAALAVYFALFVPRKLSRGERALVLALAASRDQAAVVFGYIQGFLEASPVLAQEIESITASEIKLRNGVGIAVHANSFRTVRGRTLLACILDEVSFWRDETSASPDVEVYRAILPALMTTGGMVIGISTPYRKIGLMHQKHRDHFGHDGDVLVVQGASARFNPLLTPELIEAQRAADPEGALAELDAEFRSDLAAFLDDETIDSSIDHGRPLELPPRGGYTFYRCFVDASGGRHDHYTIAIGHKERTSGQFILDVVRGARPPFDPQTVTRDYAELCAQYRIRTVSGDNFAQEWVQAAWRSCGVRYVRAEQVKSQIYLECLPLFMRGLVRLPDHPRLLRELRLLERHTHRSGKDTVDHGRNGHDDYINATCGVLRSLANYLGYSLDSGWLDPDPDDRDADKASRDAEYQAGLVAHMRRFGMPV
jgi:hypothetical protein